MKMSMNRLQMIRELQDIPIFKDMWILKVVRLRLNLVIVGELVLKPDVTVRPYQG